MENSIELCYDKGGFINLTGKVLQKSLLQSVQDKKTDRLKNMVGPTYLERDKFLLRNLIEQNQTKSCIKLLGNTVGIILLSFILC